MRSLTFLASIVAAGAIVCSAGAASPNAGELSVERGKGSVVLEIRGSVLGRLATGTLRVTDLTPRDRFVPLVAGRKITQERVSPQTVVYRGQGLRFRMLGGGYRIVARGSGVSISAVGRGAVTLHGDRKAPGDDAGVYSLDGADCGVEPELCTPLPDEPERFPLIPWPDDGSQGR
ncbi:MAG TPA: hypothetical protein VK926_02350 [Gaiellaceae bacterium]|nr:hypothetical protein [Gaiellaceae bacterium]